MDYIIYSHNISGSGKGFLSKSSSLVGCLSSFSPADKAALVSKISFTISKEKKTIKCDQQYNNSTKIN